MFSILWYVSWIVGRPPGIVTPFLAWFLLDAIYVTLFFVIKAALAASAA